jgi:hypothetical protein
MVAFAVISTAAVVLGFFGMPYGYYALLRVVLCLTGAVGFAAARKAGDGSWQWVYGVVAVLYNPLFPVHLGGKAIWSAVNVVAVVVLWFGATRFRGALATQPPPTGQA